MKRRRNDTEEQHDRVGKFAGEEYHDPVELAVPVADWNTGVKHFGRGFITEWVKDELADAGQCCGKLDGRRR